MACVIFIPGFSLLLYLSDFLSLWISARPSVVLHACVCMIYMSSCCVSRDDLRLRATDRISHASAVGELTTILLRSNVQHNSNNNPHNHAATTSITTTNNDNSNNNDDDNNNRQKQLELLQAITPLPLHVTGSYRLQVAEQRF